MNAFPKKYTSAEAAMLLGISVATPEPMRPSRCTTLGCIKVCATQPKHSPLTNRPNPCRLGHELTRTKHPARLRPRCWQEVLAMFTVLFTPCMVSRARFRVRTDEARP